MTTLCTASKAAPLRDRRDDLYGTPEVAVEALHAPACPAGTACDLGDGVRMVRMGCRSLRRRRASPATRSRTAMSAANMKE